MRQIQKFIGIYRMRLIQVYIERKCVILQYQRFLRICILYASVLTEVRIFICTLQSYIYQRVKEIISGKPAKLGSTLNDEISQVKSHPRGLFGSGSLSKSINSTQKSEVQVRQVRQRQTYSKLERAAESKLRLNCTGQTSITFGLLKALQKGKLYQIASHIY